MVYGIQKVSMQHVSLDKINVLCKEFIAGIHACVIHACIIIWGYIIQLVWETGIGKRERSDLILRHVFGGEYDHRQS